MISSAVFCTVSGIVSALLIAFIGAVWRLGSNAGGLRVLVGAAGESLKGIGVTLGLMQEKLTDHERRIGVIEAQWNVTHGLVTKHEATDAKVAELRERVSSIEVRCGERENISWRNAALEADIDAGDGVVAHPVGCPTKGGSR